ncbi:hypothetical protein VI26_03840 [Chromobacterium sp. LK1]|nr:hypothetical protein VI26_03840 [Chromobacterium sp. LK1]
MPRVGGNVGIVAEGGTWVKLEWLMWGLGCEAPVHDLFERIIAPDMTGWGRGLNVWLIHKEGRLGRVIHSARAGRQ